MTSIHIHNTLIPIGEEDAREMWGDGVLSMFDDAYSITTNRALNTAEVEQLCLAIWRAAEKWRSELGKAALLLADWAETDDNLLEAIREDIDKARAFTKPGRSGG